MKAIKDRMSGFWGRTCARLGSKNKKLIKALEFINNTAPAMYEYNEVELRMVLMARRAIKENK